MKTFRLAIASAGVIALASAGVAFGSSAHASGASTTVTTKKTALGTILVTSTGRTLYLDKGDKPGHSACMGGCLSAWPPLKAVGTLKAGGAAEGERSRQGQGTGRRAGHLQRPSSVHLRLRHEGRTDRGRRREWLLRRQLRRQHDHQVDEGRVELRLRRRHRVRLVSDDASGGPPPRPSGAARPPEAAARRDAWCQAAGPLTAVSRSSRRSAG